MRRDSLQVVWGFPFIYIGVVVFSRLRGIVWGDSASPEEKFRDFKELRANPAVGETAQKFIIFHVWHVERGGGVCGSTAGACEDLGIGNSFLV